MAGLTQYNFTPYTPKPSTQPAPKFSPQAAPAIPSFYSPASGGTSGLGGFLSGAANGAMSGAGTGAMIGAMGGPIGMGAGALIGGGISALGGLFSGLSASKQKEADRKAQAAQLAQQQHQFDATTALNATQMDPMVQQRSRQKQALLASLMGSPGMSHPQSIDFSQANPFFSAGARQAADSQFQNTASAASPTYQRPDLSSVGYGDPRSVVRPGEVTGGNPDPNSLVREGEMDPRRKALLDMLMANRAGRNGGQ